MTEVRPSPSLPEGLLLLAPEAFARKLGWLMLGRGVRGVVDFDHTVTTEKTTWDVVREVLPPAGQNEIDSGRRRYIPQVKAGTLRERASIKWSTNALNLLEKYKVPISALRGAACQVPPRDGAADLLKTFGSYGMPLEIHSAGIADVIEAWLEAQGLDHLNPEIVSTRLNVNSDGLVSGWDRDTLVHVLNKQNWGIARHAVTSGNYPYTVAAGDGLHDIHMTPKGPNVLGIFVCDAANGDIPNTLRLGCEAGFDAAVIGSLDPLTELLRQSFGAQSNPAA